MNNDNNTVKSDGVKKTRRQLVGEVVSAKMTKTVIVKVNSVKVHPKYHKRYTVSKKFPSHNELEVKVGDKVTIEESKPYSKTVFWTVVNKI